MGAPIAAAVPARQLARDDTKFVVSIGERDYTFSGRQIQDAEAAPLGTNSALRVRLAIATVPSSLPWTGPACLNWPGDFAFLHAVAQSALVPSVMVVLLGFFLSQRNSLAGRNWCRQMLGLSPDDGKKEAVLNESSCPASPSPFASPLFALVFLGGMLAFLELRQPFYFTQSDNVWVCLPMILTGCRSIWLGEFPEYNPYLFLGSPLGSLGIYSLTYPPTLLSYAVARHVLHQEYATLEVFAFLHIFAGYFATRWLGRKLGLSGLTCNLIALSCVLSGSALIMGRSWFNFLPLIVWLPLLFLGLIRLTEPAAGRIVDPVGGAQPLPAGDSRPIPAPCHLVTLSPCHLVIFGGSSAWGPGSA